jgi:antitoxin HicB
MTSLENYLSLPYTTVLKRDDDGEFVATVKELKGCIAHGATEVAALKALESMKVLWIESCLADGDNVPLPEDDEDLPSGKWLQRVPRSLHAALAKAAAEEDVSLNQFVVSVLATEVGRRTEHAAKTSGSLTLSAAHVDRWPTFGGRVLLHRDCWAVEEIFHKQDDLGYLKVLTPVRKNNTQSITLPIETKAHGKENIEHEKWPN